MFFSQFKIPETQLKLKLILKLILILKLYLESICKSSLKSIFICCKCKDYFVSR